MDKVSLTAESIPFMGKRICSIAIYSVRYKLISPRVICLFVLLATFVWSNISPVIEAVKIVDLRVNPLLFPFLSSNTVYQLIIFLGVLFLFSDAPFIDKNQPYIIIRSKRTIWALGQILHVIMLSASYFLILMGISILVVLPYATLATDGWGKLVNTLAQTNLDVQVGMTFDFSKQIVSLYAPLEAFLYCFLLNWGMASFLGLLIFAINMKFSKMIGILIGLSVLLFDLLSLNNLSSTSVYFSPLSLSRLSMLDPKGITIYPSVTYALVFYCVSIVLLSICIVAEVKTKDIEISSEA